MIEHLLQAALILGTFGAALHVVHRLALRLSGKLIDLRYGLGDE